MALYMHIVSDICSSGLLQSLMRSVPLFKMASRIFSSTKLQRTFLTEKNFFCQIRSTIHEVWPAVKLAVQSKHRQLRLPGKPFMSCRMTQLYDEGGVLYMYMAISTTGLEPQHALKAFETLEHAARCAILNAGGCLSHHHGVGKLRASLLPETQSPVLTQALRNFKMALDPSNILAARNGTWSTSALPEDSEDLSDSEPTEPRESTAT